MMQNYDNGADGSSEQHLNKRHVKRTKRKELKCEILRMKAELEKTMMEKEELSRRLAEIDDANFDEARSSTMYDQQTSENETFFTTMNNLSLTSLNIPECTPAAGDTEINKRGYDHWKGVFNASLNLIQASDEATRYDLFRIKAGPLLLELFEGTTTQQGMPDEKQFAYSNAMARLDAHFASRAYILSQRSKLTNMAQRNGEPNIDYVKRVAAASKLCNYKPDEEFEAMSRTITRGSTDSRIRTLAYRVLTDGGSLNELLDQVRIRQVELENEDDYRRLHHPRVETIAAVSRQSRDHAQSRRSQYQTPYQYKGNRGSGRGGFLRVTKNQRINKSCWRCLSTYHTPADCFHADKICRSCGRRGHIERACSTKVKQELEKRRCTEDEAEPPSKIAAILQMGEEEDHYKEVMQVDNNE
ncbi:uncharacterized protein LOC128732562 [Sabethes cyaneus]|uniref:uncharacterized protein LOC128732562 n=1 Tax=Sabethes cyaneus TaxID=53552 RepID=UPI00237D57CF|nr:uncharacterized protein LOC128732562 [Sabethes cyaneus]